MSHPGRGSSRNPVGGGIKGRLAGASEKEKWLQLPLFPQAGLPPAHMTNRLQCAPSYYHSQSRHHSSLASALPRRGWRNHPFNFDRKPRPGQTVSVFDLSASKWKRSHLSHLLNHLPPIFPPMERFLCPIQLTACCAFFCICFLN